MEGRREGGREGVSECGKALLGTAPSDRHTESGQMEQTGGERTRERERERE